MTEQDQELAITSTIEDYLEGILFLCEEKGYAQVTEIAKSLEVSKASVTEMVSKLKDNDLVNYEKYGTITLTEKGKEIALEIKDRHMTLQSLLLLIGVSSENAENDCCSMEHNLSVETIKKIKTLMRFFKDENQKDVLERFNEFAKKNKDKF